MNNVSLVKQYQGMHSMQSASDERAVAQFFATIFHAFNQAPDYPETPTNERQRYSAALIAVARFCDLKDPRLGRRFFELSSAIADLDSGTVSPLLRPIEPNNRHADSSRLWRARARVALALEALICSGLSSRAAATQLAHKFPKIARLAGAAAKNSTLQTTIGGWRKALSADKVKNFEARELFLAGLELIRKLPKTELIEFSERQLADVAQLSRELSPGG